MNKKYFSKIILTGMIGALLFGCEKDPDLRMPELQEAVTPNIYLSETSDLLIDYYNPEDFQGEVTVDYYWESYPPQSMDLVVVYNNDRENQVVLQQGITTFPSNIQFSVQDLVDALPNLDDVSELNYTDRFDFYANILMEDGTLLNGADTLYTVGSSDISNYPGVSVTIYLGFKCTYDQVNAIGDYYTVSPPSDWWAEGPITITADPVDPFTVYVTGLAAIEGLTEDGDPIPHHIDPVTFAVTADKTVIASNYWGYTNGAFAGTGTFGSCTGIFEMSYNITVEEGNFGTFKFTHTPD